MAESRNKGARAADLKGLTIPDWLQGRSNYKYWSCKTITAPSCSFCPDFAVKPKTFFIANILHWLDYPITRHIVPPPPSNLGIIFDLNGHWSISHDFLQKKFLIYDFWAFLWYIQNNQISGHLNCLPLFIEVRWAYYLRILYCYL